MSATANGIVKIHSSSVAAPNRAIRPGPLSLFLKPCMTYLPTATYRLQFHQHFTFVQARALVPYLARLGISHVYASPIFRAARQYAWLRCV